MSRLGIPMNQHSLSRSISGLSNLNRMNTRLSMTSNKSGNLGAPTGPQMRNNNSLLKRPSQMVMRSSRPPGD